MIFRKKKYKKYKYNIIQDTISQKYIKLPEKNFLTFLYVKIILFAIIISDLSAKRFLEHV